MTAPGTGAPPPADHEHRDRIAPSPGVLLAPLGGGAIACDLVDERAHVLDAAAAWILASADGEVTVDRLVDAAVTATGAARSTVAADVTAGVAALRGLGLLDRAEPYAPPPPMPGSSRPAAGRATGAVHAVLDHGIAFRSTDPDLLAEVDRYLGMAVDDRAPTLWFDLDGEADGSITLTTADEWRFPTRSAFYAQLPGVVNEYAARTHGSLVLHAGAVRTPDGRIVLVPGHIDAGKSTLVAAMVQAGCDYLGDESIAIRTGRLHAVGYPKPLTLDASSRAVLGLRPSDEPHLDVEALRRGTVRLAGAVGPVSQVVLTEYVGPRPSEPSHPALPTETTRLSAVEAAKALLANTLNLARAGEPGLATLCRLAETVPTILVTHSDSVGLAHTLTDGPV